MQSGMAERHGGDGGTKGAPIRLDQGSIGTCGQLGGPLQPWLRGVRMGLAATCVAHNRHVAPFHPSRCVCGLVAATRCGARPLTTAESRVGVRSVFVVAPGETCTHI
eukprot:2747481-Prymnesium_polylepis.1